MKEGLINKLLVRAVILTCLMILARSYRIYIRQILQCVQFQDSENGYCQKWMRKETLFLRDMSFQFNCFPENTQVITKHEGPKKIQHLSIGDQVLGYNSELHQNEYSPIVAWLHRETHGRLEFNEIVTQEGYRYISSADHDIAVSSANGLSFKFAEQLEEGEQLLVGSSESQHVLRSNSTRMLSGMYSPYTKLKNFFILPYDQPQQEAMILVHCFSQLSDPQSYEFSVDLLISTFDLLGLNAHENSEYDEYRHPIVSLLEIFGENGKKVKYEPSLSPSQVESKEKLTERRFLQEVNLASSDDYQQHINRRLAIFFEVLSMNQIFLYNN